jgi:N-acetylmuramoyl-L-alanine amidase
LERKLQSNLLVLTPGDFISVPVVMPTPVVKQEETKTEDKIQPVQEAPQTKPVYHTVQTGETIYRICTKYKITEERLRSLNQIKGNNIMVGQKLRIQ